MPITTRIRNRVAIAAAGTAVLVAVGGGTTAAFAASSAPAASSSSTCTVRLGAVLRAPEAALQSDLKAVRKADKGDRADARKSIRTKLLSGAYGARERRIAVIAAGSAAAPAKATTVPVALKADLKHLRTTTKAKTGERRDAAAAIVKKAESGSYGTVYQDRAKALQARCAAK